jgi:hypothetical protein
MFTHLRSWVQVRDLTQNQDANPSVCLCRSMLDVGSSERELLDVSKMVVSVELSVEAGMGVSGQA